MIDDNACERENESMFDKETEIQIRQKLKL